MYDLKVVFVCICAVLFIYTKHVNRARLLEQSRNKVQQAAILLMFSSLPV